MKFYQKYGSLTRPLYNIATFMTHEQQKSQSPFKDYIGGLIEPGIGEIQGPPRGRTFFDQRLGWEDRRVERIQKGEHKPYVVVDDLAEYQRLRGLDTLTGTNGIWDIRYEADGYLRIPIRYRRDVVEEEDGTRRLHNPENIDFVVVLPKGTPKEVLDDLPKGRGVDQMIFHRFDGAYEAMGGMGDVLEGIMKKADKGEVQFVRRIIEFTEDEMLGLMQSGKITRTDARSLSKRTIEFIKGLGVVSPRDEKKLRGVEKLEDVVTWGRRKKPPNFLVIVSKLGAAHTAATDRLAKLSFYIEKFSGFYQVLFLESEGSTWILKRVYDQLDRVTWHYAFTRPNANVTSTQTKGMVNAVTRIAQTTSDQIRVRPFVVLSRWLSGILVEGLTDGDLATTCEILEIGEEEARKVIRRPSVISLIGLGNFVDVKRRLGTAKRGIKRSVARYETQKSPLFI